MQDMQSPPPRVYIAGCGRRRAFLSLGDLGAYTRGVRAGAAGDPPPDPSMTTPFSVGYADGQELRGESEALAAPPEDDRADGPRRRRLALTPDDWVGAICTAAFAALALLWLAGVGR